MKNWIKKHYRVVISLLLFVASYMILDNICSQYIKFDTDSNCDYNKYRMRERTEYNTKIARFYYIQLPIGAAIPSLLYIVSALVYSKKDDDK